jgi:hypothetical protein
MTPAGTHQVRLFVQAKAGAEFFDRIGGVSLTMAYAAPFERGELHCLVTTDRFAKDEEIARSLHTLADRLHPSAMSTDLQVADEDLAQLLRVRAAQEETSSDLAQPLATLADRLHPIEAAADDGSDGRGSEKRTSAPAVSTSSETG